MTTARAFLVTVNPINDAPVAANISVATDEDVPAEITPFPAYASDIDGDALTVSSLGTPAHGTAVTHGLTIVYTPTLNFVGDDAFTYTVRDPGGLQATAWITVQVGGVNDAPVATDDIAPVTEDTPASGNVLTNDTDVDGNPLTVTQFVVDGTTYPAGDTATIPGVGTLVINPNGTFTFTPSQDYNGPVPVATYTGTMSSVAAGGSLTGITGPSFRSPVSVPPAPSVTV